jgi:C4-dicarboxylate-specific signal transduction histidine kinase
LFITKLAGEGTGLGPSITYDIATKEPGGTITMHNESDTFTESVANPPRGIFATNGRGA